MTINSGTGVISGSPTELAISGQEHTVTASDAGGSISVKIFISVKAACPMIQYESEEFILIRAQAQLAVQVVILK